MKIKAIAPWFGGKRTLAPRIVQELGPHSQYFEPFCGSMAVLFAKEPARQETVNDLHGDLINLARVIQDPHRAFALFEMLNLTLFTDDLMPECKKRQNATDLEPLERAYWYFIESWCGRNGVAGTLRQRGAGYSLAVRWTNGGGSPTIRLRSAIESLPAWFVRLQNVVILQRDAFDFLPKLDDTAETAIYADPPYHNSSRSGYASSGAHSRYEHEFDHHAGMFGDDHQRLRDELQRFKKARVVVSYYDCPRIRQLYDGWTFIDCARQKHLHAQNGRGARKLDAPELLIVNGPSFTEPAP